MKKKNDENIYVVSGLAYDDVGSVILATYSNYEAALAHAKYYVNDDDPEVKKVGCTIFVHGKGHLADIRMFQIKEKFDNE